ncbi:hypothetical protein K7X08_021065 [Anisodus acutangulus]|uniref:Uncharacterized protein n=1 Tax=Anisodus acutangulus TaxID=402998 RepID=A0A9Q1M2Q7_9SOLA|nr:hypothetical protein K7X08_021065 [Anisodus acutangulus]
MDVLKNHKGTRKIEGIVLDFEKKQDENSLKKVLKKYIGSYSSRVVEEEKVKFLPEQDGKAAESYEST